MPADVGRHIHQDQTGTRPDQAVCQARKLNALQIRNCGMMFRKPGIISVNR